MTEPSPFHALSVAAALDRLEATEADLDGHERPGERRHERQDRQRTGDLRQLQQPHDGRRDRAIALDRCLGRVGEPRQPRCDQRLVHGHGLRHQRRRFGGRRTGVGDAGPGARLPLERGDGSGRPDAGRRLLEPRQRRVQRRTHGRRLADPGVVASRDALAERRADVPGHAEHDESAVRTQRGVRGQRERRRHRRRVDGLGLPLDPQRRDGQSRRCRRLLPLRAAQRQ